MVFHNYVAVAVRLDRGAAPAFSDRSQLLNPAVSALLNEKVYGNVLLLRVFKLVRHARQWLPSPSAGGGEEGLLGDGGGWRKDELNTQNHPGGY
jgi:hypothetical protein